MAGVNKVILLGNLGADPEVRALPSGVKVANINIALPSPTPERMGNEWTKRSGTELSFGTT